MGFIGNNFEREEMNVKKILALIMIAMIIVLGISIEKDKGIVDNSNPYDKYINYNMIVNPTNLKLTSNEDVREKDLLINLFQGLVQEDDEGDIVGGLAESYEISEDGLQYKFTLRQDIYYSTGEKIAAKDFVEFFKAFIDDKDNVYRSDLDVIYGVKDYREGKVEFSQVAIIPSEDSLIIRLNSPCPYFLQVLSHPVYVLRDYNKVDDFKKNYKTIRYTGPYVISDISTEDIIISKNNKYYRSKEVTGEQIRISFIESPEDALAIFEDTSNKVNDKIDLMMNIPVNEVYRLKEEDLIKDFQSNERIYLNFKNNNEAMENYNEFKIAIKDALDREHCSEAISYSLINPIYSTVKGQEEAVAVFKPQWESEEGDFLKELDKDNNIKFKVVYEDLSLQRRIAKELCEELTTKSDIEFQPIGYSKEELDNILKAGNYDIYISSFNFKYNPEFEYLKFMAEELGDENLKGIVSKALYNTSEEAMAGELYKGDQVLFESMKSVPLYEVNNVVCAKGDISGFYVNKRGNISLENIERVR